MFWRTPIHLLGALSAVCNALLVENSSILVNETSPDGHPLNKRWVIDYVFRADSRNPEQIQEVGGFWAKGYSISTAPKTDISLYNHVIGADSGFSNDEDGYVSTTASSKVAEGWIIKRLGGKGFVYTIAAYGNLIDVKATLLAYNKHDNEQEFAAIKFIPWGQVQSFKQYMLQDGYTVEKPEYDNPLYNSRKYGGKAHAGAQYTLAGFPREHPAWIQDPWWFYTTCRPAKRGLNDDSSGDGSTVNGLSARAPAKKTVKETSKKPAKGGKGGATKGEACAMKSTNQQAAKEYLDALEAGRQPKPMDPKAKRPTDKGTTKKGKSTKSAKKGKNTTKKSTKKAKKSAQKARKPAKKSKKTKKRT